VIKWLKYVTHSDLKQWEELGWEATGALIETHHGVYSDLMIWSGVSAPLYPKDYNDAKNNHA